MFGTSYIKIFDAAPLVLEALDRQNMQYMEVVALVQKHGFKVGKGRLWLLWYFMESRTNKLIEVAREETMYEALRDKRDGPRVWFRTTKWGRLYLQELRKDGDLKPKSAQSSKRKSSKRGRDPIDEELQELKRQMRKKQ